MTGDSREPWALRVLSGEDRSARASLLRAALTVAEPLYATAMRARNAYYDACAFASKHLPRPTISVGNLTTGGTGKTPVVLMLAESLIDRGVRPAILMRGYRAKETGGTSDEQRVLQQALGGRAIVLANPDRIRGAALAMQHLPQPDLFILDDGFQHRRAKRDFDLVLIDASEPFGYGHVLPRGLLRERVGGLRRADAVLVTRTTTPAQFERVRDQVRRHNHSAPIFFAEHVHAGLVGDDGTEVPIDTLSREKFLAFAGIANPQSLESQLANWGTTFAGIRAFRDHHAYAARDLHELASAARAAGASMLVTTEKDWVKIAPLDRTSLTVPILRLKLALRMPPGDGDRLIELALSKAARSSSA